MEYIRGILNNFWRLTEATRWWRWCWWGGMGPLSLSLSEERRLCAPHKEKSESEERERESGERMHPSCASRFLPVTSSCLAFYLGQTGIRLNALIKLLTWFGRPGGHRVSADELDLFCLCLPPPCSNQGGEEGGTDRGCTRISSGEGPSRLLVSLSHPSSSTIAIRILISRSTTCPTTSGYLTAGVRVVRRGFNNEPRPDVSCTPPPFLFFSLAGKENRTWW